MKKLLAILFVLALSMGLFAACGQPENTGPDAEKRFVFTVGFDQNFPPFGYVGDDGEFTGFDLEMAAALCDRLDWELKLQPIDWDSKELELSSGTIDCIWNGFTINGREDSYTWTRPYMDNSQVFVVKADSGITAFDDLAGKSVATQTDSSALAALESDENAALKDSFGELRSFADYNTAFLELEAGAIDAIAMDVGVAKFQIEGREDQFVILEQELASEFYGVGFLLGNTDLRDKVQAELDAMAADGTFAKISEAWFGYNVWYEGA